MKENSHRVSCGIGIPAIIDIIINGHEKVATSLFWNAQKNYQSTFAQRTQLIDSLRNPLSRALAQSLRVTAVTRERNWLHSTPKKWMLSYSYGLKNGSARILRDA
jgi:hypothetical protein